MKHNRTAQFSLSEKSGENPAKNAAARQGYILVESRSEAERLLAEGIAETIEPNVTFELFNNPDDEYYLAQWNLASISFGYAFEMGLQGDGVKVAVIDSGIYRDHPDFVGINIAQGYNYVDSNTDISDTTGHGTFVSGIMAARINNGTGLAGVACGVEIIPLKCFKKDTDANYYDILNAICAAVDVYECDVINMSFGTTLNTILLEEVIQNAEDKGVIAIAAVGNSKSATLYYPAALNTVVGVGSINSSMQVSNFSQFNSSVFVTAPGENILGMGNYDSPLYKTGNGTSYSTPHVAALAAIAKSLSPDLTPAEFRRLMEKTSTDYGDAGWDCYYGHGVINIEETIKYLLNSVDFYAPSIGVMKTADARISVNIKFFNNEQTSKTATIVTVLYENNRMADCVVNDISLDAQESAAIKVEFDAPGQGVYSVKQLYLNNLPEFTPLINNKWVILTE